MPIIAGKVLLGIACTVLGILLPAHPRLSALSERRFRIAVLTFWILTRPGLFAAVFLILRLEVPSDVAGAYMPQAHLAMRGLLVYRDFVSSYAPLFPYALAEALKYVWASSKMVVVLAMLAELVSLSVWMKVLEALLPPGAARQATLLYVVSAVPMVNVALEGQNQVWISLFVGVALWFYTRRSVAASGFVLSVPLVLVKFLALVTVPAFFPRNSRAFRFVASFAAAPVVVYGFLVLHHVDVLVPVRNESDARTSGNIPFLITAALRRLRWEVPTCVIDGVALLALAALALWLVSRQPAMPTPAVLWALNLMVLTLMLASKKSYPAYLVMCFFPLCAIVAREAPARLRAVLFGLFGLAAMIEPTLWFRWVKGYQIRGLAPSIGAGVPPWRAAMFIFIDLALVGLYAFYWRASWRAFGVATRAALSHTAESQPLEVRVPGCEPPKRASQSEARASELTGLS